MVSVKKDWQNQISEFVLKLLELFHKGLPQLEQKRGVLVQIGITACV